MANKEKNKDLFNEETTEAKVEDNKKKFKPGIGVDVGTSTVVVTRQTEDDEFINKFHRDMLFQLDASDESDELLQRGDYLCVKTKENYYIIGDDALKLASAIGRSDKIVRPMSQGVLNASLSSSSELLFFILKALCGSPIVEKEPLRFTIPANPIDKNLDNRFHQMVLNNFFNKLGFDAKPINEGMALAIDCCPVVHDGDEEASMSGISCSFGGGMINCLSGETKIKLLNGDIHSIKDLCEIYKDGREFWVYSCLEDGRIVPGKAHHPRKTKSVKKIVRVHLDNNKHEDCTPEHLWMMRDGTYKKASDLKEGDSLMPLYLRDNSKDMFGYYQYYKNNDRGGWKFVHRMACEFFNEVPKNSVVHHYNFNKKDNSPSNLLVLTKEEHSRLHAKCVQNVIERTFGKTYEEIYGVVMAKEIKEKMSKRMLDKWSKNPRCFDISRAIIKEWSKLIKGHSFEEIYGKEASDKIKEKMSNSKIGKTYKEIYGEEVSRCLKDKKSKLATQQCRSGTFGTYARTESWKEKCSRTFFKKGLTPWNKNLSSEEYIKHLNIDNIKTNAVEQWKNPENKRKSMISKGMSIVNKLKLLQLEINENNYEKTRRALMKYKYSPISYDRWMSYFDNDEIKMKEYVQNHNHKVVKIEHIDKECDVYDMTVDDHHNFALDSGVFVHNCAILFKGLELDSFSITSSGDAIDASASAVTGIPVANIIKTKEKKLDLDNVDMNDRSQQALSIYMDEMIERVVKAIGSRLKDKKSEMEGKVEIVVGGGSSMNKGFISRLEAGFKKFPLPLDILRVRHSSTPFYSVAQGACIRAMADFAKRH